jgi:hypothetical protein
MQKLYRSDFVQSEYIFIPPAPSTLLRMGWLSVSVIIAYFSGSIGVKLQGPLVLDPDRTVRYTEAQLAAFYPPQMTITMGPVPIDLFNSSTKLGNSTIPDPPLVS